MAWTELDTSVWNLMGTAAVGALVACGPAITLDEGETDGETETSVGPTTTPPSTLSVTGPPPTPNCYTDSDCDPGEYCRNGECYYDYCCGEDEGWYYDCYSHQECYGGDQYCENGYCNNAADLQDCGTPELTLEQILDIPEGANVDLTFTEFDGDGVPDLVVLQDTGVVVQTSTDGLWQTFTVPDGELQQITSADIDNDADQDLIISYSANESWTVATLSNDGMFGYTLATVIAVQDDGTSGFVVTSFTGDENLDLAKVGGLFAVDIYAGDGLGGFERVGGVEDSVQSLASVDQDGDGHDDLIAHEGGSTRITYGGGIGDVQWTILQEPYPDDYSRQVATGDINGDGRPDIVAARIGRDPTMIAQWDGVGLNRLPYRTAWVEANQIVPGDIEGDGRTEILVGTDSSLEIWSNTSPDELLGCTGSIPLPHAGNRIAFDPSTGTIAVSDAGNVTLLRPPPPE